MAKQLSLASGVSFLTLTAAKAHFSVIREATPPGTKVANPDRSDILDVYRRYCAATNYPAVDAIDVTGAAP